uniref:Uncharacterized protein n=1 Tax=Anguilla anguilla TaxID=7936 RepID=A0A0E9QZ75_ANGAN
MQMYHILPYFTNCYFTGT